MSYSIRPIQFSGYKHLKEKQAHEQILSGNDERQQAQQAIVDKIARERAGNKASKTLMKGAVGAIGADVFTASATKTGELGAKLGAGISRTAGWTSSLGTISGYTAAINKIMDNSDSIKEASREHPIATALLYMAGGIASLTGMDKLYQFTKNAVAKKFPNEVASLTKKVDSVKTAIDKSWVNKELAKPVKDLAGKIAHEMPTVTKAVKVAAPYAPFAILGGAAIKTVADLNKDYRKEKANIEKDIKAAQEAASLKASLEKIQQLDNLANSLNSFYFVTSDIAENADDILGGKAASVKSDLTSNFDDDDDDSYIFEESDENLSV